ncbi:DUF6049 family protein [Georgenia sp. MJ170]|uniref:DUF6049 family protein n=1 Tax=Georgenia sunbinii TaxID=3117728 RepID=UPI002F26C6B6
MRSIRHAVLALALILSTAIPTFGVAPAPDDPTAGETAGEVTVSLTSIEPAVLRPGDDLVVRGTVINDTDAPLVEPELRLRAQQRTPISRSMLEQWLLPGTFSSTYLLQAVALEEPVAAGEVTSFAIRVPAEELPLDESYVSWGPRGLEVAASDAADPVTPAATARSFLLWWPDLDIETMPLAVLGAATPTAGERTTAHLEGTSVAEAAADRLTGLVGALDEADVDLAVDPSLLVGAPDPVDLTGDGAPADGPTTAPPEDEDEDDVDAVDPAVTALREAVASFAGGAGRTVHALPWADADVAALTHLGRTDLLDDGADLTVAALEQSGLAGTVSSTLAWPAATQPDAATLATVAGRGATAAVLPSSALEVVDQLTYTPSGRAELAGDGWQLPAALSDDRLSALLAGERLPFLPADVPAAIPLDALTARQLLLAETAVVTRERPTDRRDLVLALPRDFAGDPAELTERLNALSSAPWLDRVDLAEVLSHDVPDDLERTELPDEVVETGELTPPELDRAADVMARTSAFAAVLEEPAALVEPVRTELLELPAVAWREAPAGRTRILGAAEDAADTRRGLVAARPGSTLNLINAEAHIPVAVSNGLTQAANVQVRLRPRDPRLVAPDAVSLTVAPHETATAQVPVHAVGSGNVVVDVILTSPAGDPIDEPTEIQVRVRADWETVGTAIVAGLLVVMIIVGLIRTVRRARRTRQGASLAEPATDTTDPSDPSDPSETP